MPADRPSPPPETAGDGPRLEDSPWPHVLAGIRAGAGLPAFMLMASLIGVGGLCRDIGYPVGAGVLSTFLIWAGPAQVLLFGSIAAGVAMPAIAVAISLSSVRFLPMCMSILPLLRRPGMPVWQMLVLMHYVAVTAWVEGMRRLPDMPRAARVPFFLGLANTVMIAAAIATGAGYYLIAELPPAFAAALLFTTPVFFTVSLIAGARAAIDWLALFLGFATAPFLGPLVPAGLDLLVVGVGMGSIAYAIHRLLKARRARAA